jgi:hypothetical protein
MQRAPHIAPIRRGECIAPFAMASPAPAVMEIFKLISIRPAPSLEGRLDLFPKGEATPAEVIACASFFFNCRTVFEPWTEKALELVDGAQFERAYVICVSDVSTEAQAEWAIRRAERGMRAYGALIVSNRDEALPDVISDAVFRLDDLRSDLSALEIIFSTV